MFGTYDPLRSNMYYHQQPDMMMIDECVLPRTVNSLEHKKFLTVGFGFGIAVMGGIMTTMPLGWYCHPDPTNPSNTIIKDQTNTIRAKATTQKLYFI